MKKYKAILFDWDGTAVLSRKAAVDEVIGPMSDLLCQGIPLVIISGTTYENIAEGNLHDYFSPNALKNLFLGLGRGAFNYRFGSDGKPYIWKDHVPSRETLAKVHSACFDFHIELFVRHGLSSDIIFSRPNYCKIDIMVDLARGDQLFLQGSELQALYRHLEDCGYSGGLKQMIRQCEKIGKERGLALSVTSDAKYIEAGVSDKSDNVNDVLRLLAEERGIRASDCSIWGDEYIGLDDGIFGSDSFMLTEVSAEADFFDVSDMEGLRPSRVQHLGGGVKTFIDFLKAQAHVEA